MRARNLLTLLLMSVYVSVMAHNVTEYDGYYEVEHTWKYKGKQCSVSLNVSTDLYDYYQNDREHLAYRYQFEGQEIPPNYFGFMLSENDRYVMRALANEFSRSGGTECDRINLALSFVQSLKYAYDSDSKGVDEYVRYPVETLVDGCGDCEDKVALLTALLYEMNVDFILLALPEHIAVGVHCDGVTANCYLQFRNKRYYYMETTTEGWEIGEIPEKYQSSTMEAVPVDDMPRLLIRGVRFESKPTFVYEKARCELQVELQNQGPNSVSQLVLIVRVIEKGNQNRLLAQQYYPLNEMAEGETRTEMLSLKSYIKDNCVVQVELRGAEVATQYYEMELNYSRRRY